MIAALHDHVAAIRHAKAIGDIVTKLSPEMLLEQILTLAHGHVMDAGDTAARSDEQRESLAVSVATLTGQRSS